MAGKSPVKMIIDTDPGVDDAMAIQFALLHRDIELIGLTTIFGNVTTQTATRNALYLAELGGASLPVAAGPATPLAIEPHPIGDFIHGKQGFGDLDTVDAKGAPAPLSAAEFLVRACAAAPGQVTICAVAPLTNLALALKLDPGIAKTVGQVVVMGGSVNAGGNASRYAEANIWHDPHAADKVFAADWPVRMIGLDVTNRITCTPADFEDLKARSPVIGGFLHHISQFYMDFYQSRRGERACALHDPAAVIAAIRPDLFELTAAPLCVALEGDEAGKTYVDADADRSSCKFASDVDIEAVKDLFLKVF